MRAVHAALFWKWDAREHGVRLFTPHYTAHFIESEQVPFGRASTLQNERSLSCNLSLLAVPKTGATSGKCKAIKVISDLRCSIACLSVACTARCRSDFSREPGKKTGTQSLANIIDSALACNRFVWMGPKEASAVSFPWAAGKTISFLVQKKVLSEKYEASSMFQVASCSQVCMAGKCPGRQTVLSCGL